jgi:hypothetical protein
VGRFAVVLVVALCGLAVGCGNEDESIPDDEIVQALKLEKSSGSGGYTIGGDPFCEVSDDLLNDPDEVEDATKGKSDLELVITDKEETVGVQGVPPFDNECESDAKRALDKLSEE